MLNQSRVFPLIGVVSLSLLFAVAGCGGVSHAAQPGQSDSAATALSTDSAARLETAFSASLQCAFGVKPYAVPVASGTWSIRFDGDELVFDGPAMSLSGRFSTSGNPDLRTGDDKTATRETHLGQSGGRLWLSQRADGSVSGAGLSGRADGTSVECGDIVDSKWLAQPASSPFANVGGRLFWNSASDIALHCASGPRGGLSGSPTVIAADLMLVADGALQASASASGEPLITLSAPTQTGRSAGFVHETTRHGGLIVWMSRSDNEPDDNIQLQWRPDFSLLELTHHRQDGTMTRCVPAPLDPRGSITG